MEKKILKCWKNPKLIILARVSSPERSLSGCKGFPNDGPNPKYGGAYCDDYELGCPICYTRPAS